MTLTLTETESRKTVTLNHEHLIQSNAGTMREFLGERLAPGDQVVIDLSKVLFMDSSGLGALVSGLKRVGATGTVTVVAPHRAVRTLFQLTRMDTVFTVVDRVDDAQAGGPKP